MLWRQNDYVTVQRSRSVFLNDIYVPLLVLEPSFNLPFVYFRNTRPSSRLWCSILLPIMLLTYGQVTSVTVSYWFLLMFNFCWNMRFQLMQTMVCLFVFIYHLQSNSFFLLTGIHTVLTWKNFLVLVWLIFGLNHLLLRLHILNLSQYQITIKEIELLWLQFSWFLTAWLHIRGHL